MRGVSTHVLDVSRGLPAAGVGIRLERDMGDVWWDVATGATDADGRCALLAPEAVREGYFRLTFAVGAYFGAAGQATIYPEIVVRFRIAIEGEGYHLPLLLSPFGYSTYRGS